MKRKSSLQRYRELQRIARSKNGTVVSKVYVHCHQPMSFRCIPCKYTWKVQPAAVRNRGSWCPSCRGRLSPAEHMKVLSRLARKNHGAVLSSKYQPYKKMRFNCKYHGAFRTMARTIKLGCWCPKCKGLKISESKMRSVNQVRAQALKLGWELVSRKYNSQEELLRWRCPRKHSTVERWRRIRSDPARCKICRSEDSVSVQKLKWQGRLNDMKQLAHNRGGECLSEFFKGELKVLEWQCSCGNKWGAIPVSVERGSWCARCSSGLGERLARVGLEQIFNTEFDLPPKS